MLITYKNCACNTWPIEVTSPVGHCGRCGEKPIGRYETKADAIANFEADKAEILADRGY